MSGSVFRCLVLFLVSVATGRAARLYWDGAASAGDPGGGTGTWNTTTLNWDTAPAGGTGVAWTTNDATFGGTTGVVTLGAAITANSLTFDSASYTIAASTRVLTVNNGVFSSLAGNVFTVTGTSGSVVIAGAGGLSAAQTVTLSSGILQLRSTAAANPLGAAELALGGGILQLRRNGTNDAIAEMLRLSNRVRVTANVTINADRTGATGGTGKVLELPALSIGAQTLTTTSGNGFIVALDNLTLQGNATLSTAAETQLGSVGEAGGAFTLTKTGAGALVFRKASSWSGGLLISSGDVEARISDALGVGAVQIGTGTGSAALVVSTTATFQNDISTAGSGGTRAIRASGGTALFFGDVALNRATTVDVGESSRIVLSGAVSGSGVLTKAGTGTLVLGSLANDFGAGAAGAIVVSGGRLEVDDDSELGNPANGLQLNGGGLLITGDIDTARRLSVTGTVNVIDVEDGSEFGVTTVGISGTGGFSKRGRGILRMDIAASASGGVTLSDGTLASAAPSGSPFGTGPVRLNHGTLVLAPLSDTLATTTLSTGALTYGGAVRIVIDNSGLAVGTSGNLLATLSTGALTRVDRGTLEIQAVAGIDLLGAPFGDGERWRVPSVTTSTPFYAPHVIAIDTNIEETPHFVRYSASQGFLSAASTYSAGFDPNPAVAAEVADVDSETIVSNESVLAMRVSGGIEIDPGVTLSIGGNSTTAGLILHGDGSIRGGRLSFGTREALVYVAKGVNSVIESDIVTSAPGGGFTKFGPGSLLLLVQNTNANPGEISVNDGALEIDNIEALGGGSEPLRVGAAEFSYTGSADAILGRPVILGSSGGAEIRATAATLTLDQPVSGGLAGSTVPSVRFSGGGVIRLSNAVNSFVGTLELDGTELLVAGGGVGNPMVLGAGVNELRITNRGRFTLESGDMDPTADSKGWFIDLDGVLDIRNGALRFNEPNQLRGTGTLYKAGAGLLEIGAGQGDFEAAVIVEQGTLLLSGGISGSVTVSSSAVLSGVGPASAVTVANGGVLSPGGTAAGRFVSSDLTLSPGGGVLFDIDGSDAGTMYDQVAVTGAVNIAGASLSLDIGIVANPGVDIFFLIVNDATDPTAGEFASLNGGAALPQGAAFLAGGQFFQISYTAEAGIGFEGVGNDVALRAVPETGSIGLLLAGMCAVASRRARKR